MRFHDVDNGELVCYSKQTEDGSNVILTVVNLNPYHKHSGWLHLDLEAARRNSPIHHPPPVGTPIVAAFGGEETPAFRQQTTDYVEAWRAAGHEATLVDMPGHHHYSLMLELHDPASPLLAALLSLMGQ